jgi:hypothetical protein
MHGDRSLHLWNTHLFSNEPLIAELVAQTRQFSWYV